MTPSRFGRWTVTLATVIVGVVLAIVVVAVVSRSPGHDELHSQQQMISEQLRFVSCLLLIPPEERLPEAVAACQVQPDDS